MSIEFCPDCRSPQNAAVTATRKEEREAAGRRVEVEIQSLACERCGTFIRSREVETPAGGGGPSRSA